MVTERGGLLVCCIRRQSTSMYTISSCEFFKGYNTSLTNLLDLKGLSINRRDSHEKIILKQ